LVLVEESEDKGQLFFFDRRYQAVVEGSGGVGFLWGNIQFCIFGFYLEGDLNDRRITYWESASCSIIAYLI